MLELSFRTLKEEINGQVLEYEDIFTPQLRITAIIEDDAHELFHRTKELFDEAGIIYSFRINMSCYIDVYILSRLHGISSIPWCWYCVSLAGNKTPEKFFREYSEIIFFGEKCMCPDKPERLLEFWYGSDWRIPQNKKGTYEVKSIVLYKRCKRFLSKCLRFIFNSNYRRKVIERIKRTGRLFS